MKQLFYSSSSYPVNIFDTEYLNMLDLAHIQDPITFLEYGKLNKDMFFDSFTNTGYDIDDSDGNQHIENFNKIFSTIESHPFLCYQPLPDKTVNFHFSFTLYGSVGHSSVIHIFDATVENNHLVNLKMNRLDNPIIKPVEHPAKDDILEIFRKCKKDLENKNFEYEIVAFHEDTNVENE